MRNSSPNENKIQSAQLHILLLFGKFDLVFDFHCLLTSFHWPLPIRKKALKKALSKLIRIQPPPQKTIPRSKCNVSHSEILHLETKN